MNTRVYEIVNNIMNEYREYVGAEEYETIKLDNKQFLEFIYNYKIAIDGLLEDYKKWTEYGKC